MRTWGIAIKALRAPDRRILGWVVVLVIVAGSLWIAVSGGRDLLLGPARWSLVALPLVVARIYFARHDGDTGRLFAGGGPYEGHGRD